MCCGCSASRASTSGCNGSTTSAARPPGADRVGTVSIRRMRRIDCPASRSALLPRWRADKAIRAACRSSTTPRCGSRRSSPPRGAARLQSQHPLAGVHRLRRPGLHAVAWTPHGCRRSPHLTSSRRATDAMGMGGCQHDVRSRDLVYDIAYRTNAGGMLRRQFGRRARRLNHFPSETRCGVGSSSGRRGATRVSSSLVRQAGHHWRQNPGG